MYKLLEGIDAVSLNFSDGGLLYMNITLAAIMFGVALEIKVDNFRRLFKQPKSAFLGIFSQFILLPALTFLLVTLLKPPASVAMGMILISACPGGNVSNFISALARANIELSVSLTAFATLAATLITPLNFAFWGGLYVNLNAEAMGLDQKLVIGLLDTAKIVFILLGIPLILGMLFSHQWPNTTKKILKTVKITSLVLYATFIFGALFANLEHFPGYIWPIALMVLFLNSQTLFTGYLVGTIARVPIRDRRTLTIETGIQNSGLALALILNDEILKNFGGMAFMAAWWGIWQMISGLGIAWGLSKIKVIEGMKSSFIMRKKLASAE